MTIDLVAARDFDRDVADSMSNREVPSCVSIGKRVPKSRGEGPTNFLAIRPHRPLAIHQAIRMPSFVDDYALGSTDSSSDSSTVARKSAFFGSDAVCEDS